LPPEPEPFEEPQPAMPPTSSIKLIMKTTARFIASIYAAWLRSAPPDERPYTDCKNGTRRLGGAFLAQPVSRESIEKEPRTRGADKAVASVCPYCAVGCSQLIYVKDKRIIDIEGNPASPINEGTLCPKGAATYQYVVNPNRVTTVRYRAPRSDHWEDRPLEWAMDRIATLIKQTRDTTFVGRTADGKSVNQTTAIATLGGATMDIEENYLIKKLFSGGLGIVSIENQARI
jgi:formate dehydrogenase major subunit